jgi:stage V sporulation protein AE
MDFFFGLLKAFFVGGLFCLAGQILLDNTKLTPARILVGFVSAGVVLGALGVYQPLVDWAGAGAAVPLTGFGCLLAEGAGDAVREDGLLGALTGPLTAGAGGVTAAVLCGLAASIAAKPKEK